MEKEALKMKVMSFNVRADSILDVRNRWKHRSEIVYEVIKKYDCDVVGLQEVTDRMYMDLNKAIDGYYMIGKGRTKRYFNERNNLLVKEDYNLLEEETFWLSKTPSKTGSSVWYSMFPRICTTAVIQLANNLKIRIYNTHLDCLLPSAREYGLKKIGEYVGECYQKEKLPCILMGDFNAGPQSKLIQQFSQGSYSDKRFIAVQDVKKEIYNEATMGHFKGKTRGLHIDYIFVSEEFEIKDVEIIKYQKNNKYPSDHYPILAEINL